MAWCEQYQGLVDATKSFSNHPYVLQDCHGVLKQQWMSLIAAQYSIPLAERIPQIWYISWKLIVAFGRNDTYGVDHKGLANAVQNFLKHNYEDKEGYETLKLQWRSPLAA